MGVCLFLGVRSLKKMKKELSNKPSTINKKEHLSEHFNLKWYFENPLKPLIYLLISDTLNGQLWSWGPFDKTPNYFLFFI